MKNSVVIGQQEVLAETDKIVEIFVASNCAIRPHFIVTGPSGSGKSLLLNALSTKHKIGFIEINAAQLTKEGTSGNSLSKALAPLNQMAGKPCIVFVDEFDKLFISGNSNESVAHESTTGVQNEFLKVLESDVVSVFGDYGKYTNVSSKNVLFVFAGAFNGEENITVDRLREMGIKTEFLGRVGLVYSTRKHTLDEMYEILDNSELLKHYLELFDNVKREDVIKMMRNFLKKNHELNTLGARLINTIVHQYFIKGGIIEPTELKQISFQKKLNLGPRNN